MPHIIQVQLESPFKVTQFILKENYSILSVLQWIREGGGGGVDHMYEWGRLHNYKWILLCIRTSASPQAVNTAMLAFSGLKPHTALTSPVKSAWRMKHLQKTPSGRTLNISHRTLRWGVLFRTFNVMVLFTLSVELLRFPQRDEPPGEEAMVFSHRPSLFVLLSDLFCPKSSSHLYWLNISLLVQAVFIF